MIVLLSPAKSLDFSPAENTLTSYPRLLEDSAELVNVLKKKSVKSLQALMGVSENIAKLNKGRFNDYMTIDEQEHSKQALYAFNGDVYLGLEANTFNKNDVEFAQKYLRILSGLYGVLRPLDIIQPYRLEMGTRLKVKKKKNLYEYWDKKITDLINDDAAESGSKYVLNLASIEYFKSVKMPLLNAELIDVDFKEYRNGVLKVISFNAKKARGKMAQLIIKEKIKNPDEVKNLSVDGYEYDGNLSAPNKFVFIKN